MADRTADTSGVDDARNTQLVEYRNKLAAIDAELVQNNAKTPKDDDEKRALEERWDDLLAERDVLTTEDGKGELDKLEARAARLENIKKTTYREVSGFPEIKKDTDEYFFRDVNHLSWREARDGALKVMDAGDTLDLTPHQLDSLDKIVRNDARTEMARRIIVTENPAYKRAFYKLTTDPGGGNKLTEEERAAFLAYEQYKEGLRAASETTTQGGYALPVFIDPSVILTDQELDNPFLRTASVVDVNTNAWKGVSAAGVAWSFDAEASEVSDDAITLAQPSVTVLMARGFIPFSIEVSQDWPGFQAEMARLLASGYDDLLLSKFTNGNGTTEPNGILTALVAQTTTETTVGTDGAFSDPDVYKVWKALGQKYRRKASWQMSVGVMNKIRQFGTSTNFHAFTVNLTEGAIDQLFYKPVYENAYMPDFTGTTGAANIAVVGDFSAYKIARRQGMEVELVPQLFHTSNNRPSGSRGWFAYARIGGNVVNLSAFQILVNT